MIERPCATAIGTRNFVVLLFSQPQSLVDPSLGFAGSFDGAPLDSIHFYLSLQASAKCFSRKGSENAHSDTNACSPHLRREKLAVTLLQPRIFSALQLSVCSTGGPADRTTERPTLRPFATMLRVKLRTISTASTRRFNSAHQTSFNLRCWNTSARSDTHTSTTAHANRRDNRRRRQ